MIGANPSVSPMVRALREHGRRARRVRGRQALGGDSLCAFPRRPSRGRAAGMVCVLPFRDDLVGNAALPALHGGVVGAFLELTALVQAIELTDSDRVPKPINFSVDYLRSVGPARHARPRRDREARPAHRQRPGAGLAGRSGQAGRSRNRQLPPVTRAKRPSDWLRPAVRAVAPYVPGEQPGPGRRVIKLNTNENPYPPSPRVLEALRARDRRRRSGSIPTRGARRCAARGARSTACPPTTSWPATARTSCSRCSSAPPSIPVIASRSRCRPTASTRRWWRCRAARRCACRFRTT